MRESEEERPYVCECGVCGDGLLRLWKCKRSYYALCDECELVWSDLDAVAEDPEAKAKASYPNTPRRKRKPSDWRELGTAEIERAGLAKYVSGVSA